MFKLLISDDEGKQTTVPLVRDEVTIGRKEGNTIRLTERNVSRRHARLQKQNGHYLLHDLGSYNGIVINGQRLLDSQTLKHGDQILIGDYKLAILEEATSQIQAPPPSSNGAHETLDAIPPAAPPAPPTAMAAAPPPPPAAAPAARVSGPPMAPPATAAAASMEIPDEIRNLRLVFLAPSGAPSPYGLDHLPIILGRSEVADISLPFSSISREHARLSMQGGSLVIEDLGSSNGVTVNGDKVPRAVITVGDHVALGVVEFRVAKRGEQTVVMNVPAEPAAKSRSALGIVIALAGLGIIGGGVAIAVKGSGSNSAAQPPTASAPELTTPTASAAGPSTATVPTAAPAPTNPVAVAPTQAAPPQQPAAPTVAPQAPAIAMAEPPTQQPENNTDPGPAPAPVRNSAPSNDHHSARTSEPHGGSSSGGSNTRIAMNPPPAQSNPNPPAQSNPTPAVRTAVVNPPPSNTGNSGGGGADTAAPLDAARACRADNACVVAALEGRARTEQEVGLLAVTYRLMGNRPSAIRTMNRYLQRWPAGPRAEGFHNYIEAE